MNVLELRVLFWYLWAHLNWRSVFCFIKVNAGGHLTHCALRPKHSHLPHLPHLRFCSSDAVHRVQSSSVSPAQLSSARVVMKDALMILFDGECLHCVSSLLRLLFTKPRLEIDRNETPPELRLCVCVCVRVCLSLCVCVCVWMLFFPHTHTHTWMYTNSHVHRCFLIKWPLNEHMLCVMYGSVTVQRLLCLVIVMVEVISDY